jgi:D-alanine-D-alanine ligase-like ATP-grasp enzyme
MQLKILVVDSDGFDGLGWFTDSRSLEIFSRVLEPVGVVVEHVSVASADELELVARHAAAAGALIWPNAYHVRAALDSPEARPLTEVLETAGAAYVGSPTPALETVLHKELCQARLAAAGIPVPRFAVVTEAEPRTLEAALGDAGLAFPVVVKPTAEAGSLGISVASDLATLAERVGSVLDRHGPKAIVEEYLESCDLTVGVFPHPRGSLLLPTWYQLADRTPGPKILDRRARLMPWGGRKKMRRVTEPAVLAQVESLVPRAVRELGIRDVTRVDGRLDPRGRLRIFDVNGMPGLEYPESVILQQVAKLRGDLDGLEALERLACTIVASAAARHGLDAPPGVTERTLFDLEREGRALATA